jgi:hypothetical protein
MPRPIETLLALPRVRLINKVPILETGKLVQRFMSHHDYHQRLAKSALQVSEGSAQQFSIDDQGLSTLLDEITTANYIVTKRSRTAMEEMLKGVRVRNQTTL